MTPYLQSSMQQNKMNSLNSEIYETDLLQLARILYRRKYFIFTFFVCGASLFLMGSFFIKTTYQSKILMAPAQNSNSSFSQFSGQFGGLASLAGISLGGEGQLTTEAIATITSRDFILSFIANNEIKQKIFYNDWDEEHRQWREPNIFTRIINGFDKLTRPPSDNLRIESSKLVPNEPNNEDTYELFIEDFISVDQDKKTGLVTIAVSAYSPMDAANWAKNIATKINERLRMAKKEEAEKSIQFLKKELQNTNIVEMQNVMYQLIEAHTQTIILTNVNEEFVFRTIDPAYIPETKYKPKRILLSIFGAIVGLCASLIAILFRFAATNHAKELNNNQGSTT